MTKDDRVTIPGVGEMTPLAAAYYRATQSLNVARTRSLDCAQAAPAYADHHRKGSGLPCEACGQGWADAAGAHARARSALNSAEGRPDGE